MDQDMVWAEEILRKAPGEDGNEDEEKGEDESVDVSAVAEEIATEGMAAGMAAAENVEKAVKQWSSWATSTISTTFASTNFTPSMENSEQFLSGMMRNVADSINKLELDTDTVSQNVNEFSVQATNALSSALSSMNVEEKRVILEQEAQNIISDSSLEFSGEPIAPWKALPEDEKENAEPLCTNLLKLVAECVSSESARRKHFLSGMAEKDGFKFDFDTYGGQAMGALEADTNLKKLRTILVPSEIQDEEFWNTYFFHVDRVRRELRAGITSEPTEAEEEEAEKLSSPAAPPSQSKRNWDEEIDKIFDD